MAGEALVVGGRRQSEVLESLGRLGLEVVSAESVTEVLWLLDETAVAVAILDADHPWDLEAGSVPGAALRRLADRFAGVPAIVSGTALAAAGARQLVQTLHPRALLHEGPDVAGLAARAGRVVGRTIGDLSLIEGHVVHPLTGASFSHPVAVRLLSSYPAWVRVSPWNGSLSAIYRFRLWLTAVGSAARVEARRGSGEYRLVTGPLTPARSVAAVLRQNQAA